MTQNKPDLSFLPPVAAEQINIAADQLVGRHGFTRADRDDIVQELALAVWQALPRHQADQSQFITFLSRIISRRVNSLLRKQMAAKRDYRKVAEATPENEEVLGLHEDMHCQRRGRDRSSDHERTELVMDLEVVLARLPERQRRVAELLKTHSVLETAQDMGLGESTVRRDMQEIATLLREAGWAPGAEAGSSTNPDPDD